MCHGLLIHATERGRASDAARRDGFHIKPLATPALAAVPVVPMRPKGRPAARSNAVRVDAVHAAQLASRLPGDRNANAGDTYSHVLADERELDYQGMLG